MLLGVQPLRVVDAVRGFQRAPGTLVQRYPPPFNPVADSKPNRLKGIKAEVPLVGTDDEIKTQLSLLLGMNHLNEVASKGLDINFEKWVEDFEAGFKQWSPKSNKEFSLKSWGRAYAERPKVKILKEAKDYWTPEGYYAVELLPNRKEEDSYLLFGTPLQLMRDLMMWMNLHLRLAKLASSNDSFDELIAAIEREPQVYNVNGHPKIKLIFLENPFEFSGRIARDSKATRGRAQISFRLMNRTNESMTKAEVETLAGKIKSKFINPVFKFTKGKELYFYKEPSLGKPFQIWAKNEAEAKKLIEQVLDLTGDSPDLDKITKRTNLLPSKAYDDTPGTKVILGEQTRLDKTRPVVEVEFTMAYLIMDGLRKPIYLVDRSYRHTSLVSPV